MNKLAVITGASSGIGYELAHIFAKNGYDLIINAENEKLHEKALHLRTHGVEVTEVLADLSTREGVDELYQQMSYLGRPVDVVVLNAGVGVGGEFVSNDYEKELYSMNLNMVNLVYLTKKFLPDMVSRNDGKILFTSSIAAQMPGPYYAVYAASKAFVQSFAEAIRFEMKDSNKNITVTALQPGATDTDFFKRANMLDTKIGEAEKADPVKVAQDGYDALMAGKDHVVSGLINKIQSTAGKIMSEQMGAAVHSKMTKPNSLDSHQ